MAHAAILFARSVKTTPSQIWLARAEQARRVAAMLSARDAALLEAYALECEAKAGTSEDEEAQRIAA